MCSTICAQPRVDPEEVVADVGAVLGGVGLELAVGGGVHPVDQDAVDVAGEQRVPLAAPDDLDDVPAGAAEVGLQLLDDLAVAGDRAVELLQVAVDDPGEVVELLAGGDPDRAERLGLGHLAVAEERPDALVAGVLDAAVLQVAVEPRLVDRVDAGEAHRDGRELPEVRHQPRVGVRREPGAHAVLDLLPEPVELLLVEPALEEGAGVDAGGGVALDVDLVAAAGVVLAAEEVVEADLVEAGRGLVRRDVAADLEALAVGAGDHDRGVPADERADPALDLLVAGEPRLALGRDGVDVVGAAQRRDAHLGLAGPLEQAQHDVAGAIAAAFVEQRVERGEPVVGLVGVDVGQLGRQALVDHRGLRAGSRAGSAGCLFGHSVIVARDQGARHSRDGYSLVGLSVDTGCARRSSPLDYSTPRGARPRTNDWRNPVSSTAGGGTAQTGPADRLGFKPGMVIQELGWDNDTDDELRVAIEDLIDADMVDGDYGNVVDAVLLWWRDEDGDLVDGLVDALTDLVGGGAIWLLTPKIGRPGAVEPDRHRRGGADRGPGADDDGRGQPGLDGHPPGRAQAPGLSARPTRRRQLLDPEDHRSRGLGRDRRQGAHRRPA